MAYSSEQNTSNEQMRRRRIDNDIEQMAALAKANSSLLRIERTGADTLCLHLYINSYVVGPDNQPPPRPCDHHVLFITFPSNYPDDLYLNIRPEIPLFHPNLEPTTWLWSINSTAENFMLKLWQYYTFAHVDDSGQAIKHDAAWQWYQRNSGQFSNFRPQLTPLSQVSDAGQTADASPNQKMMPRERPSTSGGGQSSALPFQPEPVVHVIGERPSPGSGGFRRKVVRTYQPPEWSFPQSIWQQNTKRFHDEWGYSVPQQYSSGALKVVILKTALDNIFQHASGDRYNERFGILIGGVFTDSNTQESWVEIVHMLPAERVRANVASVEVSNEEISRLNEKVDAILTGTLEQVRKIGWYHTHPNHGIFMSGTDQTNQQLSYNAPWQVALVVDPIRRLYGAFAGSQCNALTHGLLVISEREAKDLNTPAYREWQKIAENIPLAGVLPVVDPQDRGGRLSKSLEGTQQTDSLQDRQHNASGAQAQRLSVTQKVLKELGKSIKHPLLPYSLLLLSLLATIWLSINFVPVNRSFSALQEVTSRQAQQIHKVQQQLKDETQHSQANDVLLQTRQKDLQTRQKDLLDQVVNLKTSDPITYRKLLKIVVSIDRTTDSGQKSIQLLHEDITYVVAPQDKINTIVQNFGISEQALLQKNPSVQADNLHVGDKLIIPGVSM